MKKEFAQAQAKPAVLTPDDIANALCGHLWQHDFGATEEYNGQTIISDDRTTYYFDKLIEDLLVKLLPAECSLTPRDKANVKFQVETIHNALVATEGDPEQSVEQDQAAHKWH